MEVLGIPQRQSSEAMAVAGSCEVFSRLLTSYIGDYFKGKILYMYVLCCVLLCIQNALGTMAYTFTHLAIYAAGKLHFLKTSLNDSCVNTFTLAT